MKNSNDENDELILDGVALRAAVLAAEAPLTGTLVKRQLFADLGLDDLMHLDLRSLDPRPALMPVNIENRDPNYDSES